MKPMIWMGSLLWLLGSGCGDSASDDYGSTGSGGAIGGGTGGTGGVDGDGGGGGAVTGGGGNAGGGGDDTGGGGGTDGNGGTGGQLATSLQCQMPAVNPSPGNDCHDTAPPALKLTVVATGLSQPLLLTHAPGDSTRLFVVQRGGVIRLIKGGSLVATPFLDISDRVRTNGLANERGLLGLAFDPDYANTKRLWVNYSGQGGNGDTIIESYLVDGTGDQADAGSGTRLFSVTQPDAGIGNHNGGMVAFGPDGCLYVAMGDGGGSNDSYGNGQDPSTALGTLLRVDVNNYSANLGAPGNMLTHPHVWNYGLRNPWRFSFDRATGDIYIGDVGQGAWEEVDVEPAGMGGRNYGWPTMEGFDCNGCNMSGLTLPVAVQQNGNNKSVIGGYVYRGKNIPGMVGRYIYGDYNSRRIWSFVWKGGGEICDEYEINDLPLNGSLSSFGEDADGELYVVEYSSGRVLRIDPQ